MRYGNTSKAGIALESTDFLVIWFVDGGPVR